MFSSRIGALVFGLFVFVWALAALAQTKVMPILIVPVGGGTGHDLLVNTGLPMYSIGTTPILVQ